MCESVASTGLKLSLCFSAGYLTPCQYLSEHIGIDCMEGCMINIRSDKRSRYWEVLTYYSDNKMIVAK